MTQVVPMLLAMVAVAGAAFAQSTATTYSDSRGKKVIFPFGDVSFADEIVSFTMGTPPVKDARWGDPKLALGAPDYISEEADERKPTAVALGCGGVLVVHFSDNA